jgi:hypothetical protein
MQSRATKIVLQEMLQDVPNMQEGVVAVPWKRRNKRIEGGPEMVIPFSFQERKRWRYILSIMENSFWTFLILYRRGLLI